MGAEAGGGGRAAAERGLEARENVIPVLEKAAIEGNESVRVHALSELLELRDVEGGRRGPGVREGAGHRSGDLRGLRRLRR